MMERDVEMTVWMAPTGTHPIAAYECLWRHPRNHVTHTSPNFIISTRQPQYLNTIKYYFSLFTHRFFLNTLQLVYVIYPCTLNFIYCELGLGQCRSLVIFFPSFIDNDLIIPFVNSCGKLKYLLVFTFMHNNKKNVRILPFSLIIELLHSDPFCLENAF